VALLPAIFKNFKYNIMEVLFTLPVIGIMFLLPLIAGFMAKSFGRKFWPWFWLSIPLPVITQCILICLPERKAVK
jgi:hypothetical protein